tara:strand:+ start:600 stop:872 length:273 start_codon:yes stop_codon:yes gene_type:complete
MGAGVTDRLEDVRNLGPKSAWVLREAGIETQTALRELGAVEAYRRVKFQFPRYASLNLLWALEAGLRGTDWRALTGEDKAALLRELEEKA